MANSSQDAAYVVTLKEERFVRSVLSVSAATGKVEEFRIVFNANMDTILSDGSSIFNNENIRAFRDITFDENAVLGKFSEEGVIEEDLVRSAARQVLRRLQASLPASN